ncbi:MAG: twin-arginine translocation signal domain-containing protein, partial [Bacillota bacterium]
MKLRKKRNEKTNRKGDPRLTRRQFLGAAAGVTVAAAVSGCDIVEEPGGSGWLPTQYGNEG